MLSTTEKGFNTMNVDRTAPLNSRRDHDILAAMLSIAPGLGHIYKGHYASGLAVLLLGVPLGIWAGMMLSTTAVGRMGLLVPLLSWGVVTMDAYAEEDRRSIN